ncbi:MAG: GNAT family N-acetyltransferase [Bacteroidia bacterium]|nr:GNAT family N-acetyltransferase [Bacteroidia bacterium]NNL82594.1 GNAT family N-acetyltransferase [Winogradskyella sp.]
MITIRKASLEDLIQVVELFDKYRVFYKKESNKTAAEKFISERLKLNESKIFIAETINGKLIGFVQLYPIFSSTRMQKLWLLNDLFVEIEHRGKGISKLLIEESKKLCKETNACGLILETEKSNIVGNNLYPSVGFSVDKAHNFYSWDNN